MRRDDQRESPGQRQLDRASGGIEGLPSRALRYGKAKKTALDVVQYIDDTQPSSKPLADRIRSCGDYLLFRHYTTVDQVKLHAASFCMKHLLCPLCAIRRGSKALTAYLERWQTIKAERPHLKAHMVTLTVKNGPDLAERFAHLQSSLQQLHKRRRQGRRSVLDQVEGMVWSYEIKRGKGGKGWHPHVHMIALSSQPIDARQLSAEWHTITGDSKIVETHEVYGDEVEGFSEVFKYACKFSDQPVADTWHAFQTLRGRRLMASSGCFRGVDIPEQLTDDETDLEGLPFVEYFYRYLVGRGYALLRKPPSNFAEYQARVIQIPITPQAGAGAEPQGSRPPGRGS